MRMLRYLLAIALVCGLSGIAKADDFQMVIIDPSYSVNIITNPSFTFSLDACVSPGQVPIGTNYQGCFTGQNETSGTLTSLLIQVPFFGQSVACNQSGTGLDYFTSNTCSIDPGNTKYTLNFTGGTGIAVGRVFTIAESGATAGPLGQFPQNNSAVATVGAAPEPASIWFMLTGVLGGGLMFADRRRRLLSPSR